ncbi:uncharacterized protein LOC113017844 isoform X2 [Astatotilapia calliptera]|uniref:uncharacterized protein LOC113017844 isoform X2 n=1 Tax=Astatotilapia calliptera TaxID=8154 RepID=UPI000E3FE40F|nr:uncharacterized protein LOC113017844 isoform X2 [Astatotilapia calliptera]
MAHCPDDSDSDMELTSLPMCQIVENVTPSLSQQVVELRTEVNKLSDCLRDSLNIQQSLLRQWDQLTTGNSPPPAVPQSPVFPMATSTPHVHVMDKTEPTNSTNPFLPSNPFQPTNPFLPSHSLKLSSTSRVIAAALHHAKLEPPVYAGDGKVQPEDWLNTVGTYKASLNLTDGQLLNELPHFLAKEPGKWFKALSSHITSWAQFCQLFKTVFLSSDNQERILRGILDRVHFTEANLPPVTNGASHARFTTGWTQSWTLGRQFFTSPLEYPTKNESELQCFICGCYPRHGCFPLGCTSRSHSSK